MYLSLFIGKTCNNRIHTYKLTLHLFLRKVTKIPWNSWVSFTQQIFTESHVRNCSAGKQRLKWIQPRPAGIEFMQGRRRGVLSLSRARPSATPWTAARQASLSITNSWSSLRLTSFESVMPSNHLILCHPLLLSPSIFPNTRVFPNESVLHNRWPKYWNFSFSISPSNEYWGLISFRTDWFDFLARNE